MSDKPQRLAKVIAAAGVCSRREAERLIEGGKVIVDGEWITTPAFNVTPDQVITVDGKPISQPEKVRLFLYHKPRDLITTHSDPQGRPTVFDALPKTMPRVVSVGRLDLNSEGLLLLTTSGAFARKLELPANGWVRRYRVRVHGLLTEAMLKEMETGVTIEDINYGSMRVQPLEKDALTLKEATNHWVVVTLTEGKNREIRRIFEHFDCKVSRLIRVSYGPFMLGELPRGEVEEVKPEVLAKFL